MIKKAGLILAAFFCLGAGAYADGRSDAAADNCRGVMNLINGKYDKAITDLSNAIAADPGYLAAYLGRGAAYQRKGEHDKALENYSRALTTGTKPADGYYNSGIGHIVKGEYDKALEDFTKASAADPAYLAADMGRGVAFAYKGKYEWATDYYYESLENQPFNCGTKNYIANAAGDKHSSGVKAPPPVEEDKATGKASHPRRTGRGGTSEYHTPRHENEEIQGLSQDDSFLSGFLNFSLLLGPSILLIVLFGRKGTGNGLLKFVAVAILALPIAGFVIGSNFSYLEPGAAASQRGMGFVFAGVFGAILTAIAGSIVFIVKGLAIERPASMKNNTNTKKNVKIAFTYNLIVAGYYLGLELGHTDKSGDGLIGMFVLSFLFTVIHCLVVSYLYTRSALDPKRERISDSYLSAVLPIIGTSIGTVIGSSMLIGIMSDIFK